MPNLCMLLLWCHYINTIAQMHAFTAIDRVPITSSHDWFWLLTESKQKQTNHGNKDKKNAFQICVCSYYGAIK